MDQHVLVQNIMVVYPPTSASFFDSHVQKTTGQRDAFQFL